MTSRTGGGRKRSARLAPWLLAATVAAATGCTTKELTELVIEIHTDYSVPQELDSMEVAVTVGRNQFFHNTYPLGDKADAGQISLPRRITLIPQDEGNPTFTVKVDGSSNGTIIVTRSATLGFVRGQSLVLRIDLLRECRGIFCKMDETCVRAGICAPDAIDPRTLPTFDSRRDASPLPPYDGPIDGAGMDRADTGVDVRDGGNDGDANDGGNDGPPPDVSGDRSSDVGAGSNGAPCGIGAQCDSGFCVDGVCCDTACTGTCQTCNLAGNAGTCSPIAAGADPENECFDEGTPSCGRDGFCDGAGACRRYAAGTLCFPQSCSGFTRVLASRCDGLGTCVFGPTQSCSPYRCGANNDCRTTCTDNSQCLSNMCAAGSCGAKPVGASCTMATDCDSGFCEQGTCCASDCRGTCKSCAIAGSAGSCIDVPAGQDPLNQCADQGIASCGTSGACDGTGSCKFYPAGASCAAATCANSMLTAAQMCDGKGTCAAASAMACDPYGCNAGACRTNCATSADCAFGAYCVGTSCIPKKSMGADCTAPGECANGVCVDGVCCDSACAGACQACNITGKLGTCSPVPGGTDPGNECADDGATSCGKDGLCDGAGACRKYPQGTVCATGSCTGSTRRLSSTCDGAGTCIAGSSLPCAPFVCGTGSDCLTTCSGNSECVSPAPCMNGSCGRSPIGASCNQPTDCDSGFCAQGVCCSTACTATCKSCALTGSIGSCVAVPAGADPLDQCTDTGASGCGTDGACDGNGACRSYGSSTICVAASCNGNNLTPASTCNGAGTCSSATVVPCSPYSCLNGLCGTSCAGDTGCAAGFFCSGTTCVQQQANGASCAIAGECASGNCVDGVCCNDSCTGACASCNVAGQVGSCAPIPAGQDPASECPDDGTTSCGRDGSCDGAGACRRYASGTVCAPASCSGSTRTLVSRCDGSGTCVAGIQQPCDPFVCGSSGDCYTSCSSASECLAPNLCVAGSCGKKPTGASCMAASDCTSGVCAQGVCCGTTCAGTCLSCALAGSEGACLPVQAGQDPLNQCTDAGPDSCGADGACDGAGACRLYGAATQCAPPTCTGTTYTNPRTCNGTGTCSAATTTECVPYTCGAATCKTSCTSTADCSTGNYCAGTICAPLKAPGAGCGGAGECASGNCVDGVCCESGCAGGCLACSNAKTGQPDGLCRPVSAGTDPNGDCTQESSSTCGTDGLCDGAGACRKWVVGTTCAIESCSGSSYTPARTCNGSGTCQSVTSTSCAPFICGATSCKTSCGTSADCTSGNFCSAGTCVAQKANGAACGGAGECASGFCIDSFCCETQCGATCVACAMAKTGQSNGLCRAIMNGTDPDNDCTQSATSTCGADGQCDGSGACRLWAASTVCVVESCSGTTYTPARTCNGTGTCQTVSMSSCVPYNCGSIACKTSCSATADCSNGNYCSGTTCVGQKANGTACMLAVECTSGNCVDGFCCESACGSTCQACSMAKTSQANGLCRSIPNGADPDLECNQSATSTCGTDGWCNGSGACRLWDATTVCAGASCTGSTYTPTRNCNGAGTCQSVSTVPCDPYACNPTACKTTCATTADCANGYSCIGTTCGTTLPLGSACTLGSQCTSANCIDGFCCESSCATLCMACSMAKTGQANGFCRGVSAGNDPDNDCAQMATSTCGTDGTCNGSGACRLWDATTVCVAASCMGSTYTPPRTCNGSGTCQTVSTSPCAPYVCGVSACKTSCTVNADCTAGNYCSAGSCVALKANGAMCGANGECSSTFCVDSVCCESGCTGLCTACSNAKTGQTNGLCRSIPNGADPDGECSATSPSTCGTDGSCNGASACRLWGPTTVCSPESCIGSTYQPAGYCGGGFCGVSALFSCDPYACGPTSCRTSCSVSTDCADGYYCITVGGGGVGDGGAGGSGGGPDGGAGGGTCAPQKPQGASCGANGECQTGFCADGFCCDSACGGECVSCGLPGTLGTCSTVYNAEDNSCNGTSICNAMGKCKLKIGQSCQDPAACASTFCADGFCCNTPCQNTCESCSLLGQQGNCRSVPPGQPDPPSCTSPNACSATGICVPPLPLAPKPIAPLNGKNTGSVFYPPALRPTFRWGSVAYATSYQIQVEDSCTTPGFATCSFPSPVVDVGTTVTSFQPSASLPVSTLAPVGRRYYWRVRGCNGAGCGAWSPVYYVNVGRLRDDVNGDGYSDVLVGAPYRDLMFPDQGRAYLYYGGNPMNNGLDKTIDGYPYASGQFGRKALIAGDLNGDGYADMAVSDYRPPSPGTVYIFYGPSPAMSASNANLIIGGSANADSFGESISSAADVDGDGFADIVIGAPLDNTPGTGVGRAFLFTGGAPMDRFPDAVIDGTVLSGTFGRAVAGGGDQNGDGVPDLFIGAPNAATNDGRAYLFHGPNFPNSAAAAALTLGPSSAADNNFGRSIASDGDIDSDGVDDVVIGAPAAREAYIFLGRSGGMDGLADGYFVNGSAQYVEFGIVVFMADVTGDGYADYFMSDDRYSSNGAVGIIFGPTLSGASNWSKLGGAGNELLGYSVAAGDVNGDGRADILISDPAPQLSPGVVYIYLGGAPPDVTLDLSLSGEFVDDSFGYSIY